MKVLQINTVCGRGSTGRIATDLADILQGEGHACRIAYGRYLPPARYQDISVRIGSDLGVKLHGVETRLFDAHGFGSTIATKHFLKWVESYDPDIIHLHNIHGYYINIELLFDYVKRAGKPVVWTLHDCWTFTGHCSHFTAVGCNQWRDGCRKCPQLKEYPKCALRGNVEKNYMRKKTAFTGVGNMTIVTPSRWLAELVGESFLRDYPVRVIPNGIDLAVFKPTASSFRDKHGFGRKTVLLGVANNWNDRKGLGDFIDLSKMLDDSYQIVLVGLTDKQIEELPDHILGIARTESVQELAEIYSAADIFLNPTYEDTFPTTNLEALACGTPVITYRSGGSPEAINESCGISVEPGVGNLLAAVKRLSASPEVCVERALNFDKHQHFMEYIELYQQLLLRTQI